jgi:putative membrane protein
MLVFFAVFGLMQAHAVEADTSDASVGEVEEPEAVDVTTQEVIDVFTPHGSSFGKNETVAVKTDLTGVVDSIAVDEWIKNPNGLDRIEDVSSLQNITPDDGLEFTREGESIVWKANGKDVVYSGTSGRELPFEVTYRYELDGVEVDPSTLQNVTGTLKIQIGYKNKTNATVSTASASYDVQDPFVMASIVSFDAEHARHVEIDHGTVVDQQGTLMAVGLGMPGLAETLGVQDVADLPESVEITADVKGFDMPDITTIATDQVLSNVEAEQTEDVRSQLGDAIGQLGNLSVGVEALAKGNKGIATATGKIAEGQAAMAKNLPNATEGIQALADVAQAANQAVSGAAEAHAGIAQNMAASAASQQQAVQNQQDALASQHAAAKSQQQAVDALAGTASLADAVGQQAAARDVLQNLLDTDTSLNESRKEAVTSAIAALDDSLNSTTSTQDAINQVQTAVGDAQTSLEEAQTSLGDSGDTLKASLESLAANEEATKTLMQSLGVATKQTEGLSTGLKQASEGFAKVQEGTEQLSEALAQVSKANKQLSKAADKMGKGVSEAIGTVQSNIDEKIDLVNALSAYVTEKPAYGGSAGDMPANTLYIVHAKAEATPLR